MSVVDQWRFTPGMKNGIAVAVPCTLELVWGQRKLTRFRARQLRNPLWPRRIVSEQIRHGCVEFRVARSAVDFQLMRPRLIALNCLRSARAREKRNPSVTIPADFKVAVEIDKPCVNSRHGCRACGRGLNDARIRAAAQRQVSLRTGHRWPR